MAQKSKYVTVPAGRVHPNQEFSHCGRRYRRATEEEHVGHPGVENPRFKLRGDIILAFSLAGKPEPVNFVDTADVVVRRGK